LDIGIYTLIQYEHWIDDKGSLTAIAARLDPDIEIFHQIRIQYHNRLSRQPHDSSKIEMITKREEALIIPGIYGYDFFNKDANVKPKPALAPVKLSSGIESAISTASDSNHAE
jgi:hypothetical protein